MFPAPPAAILPEPPDQLKRHSEALAERIRARIIAEGPIGFADYMDMALYEPGLGYYSAGLHKFGEAGDFITAPELGSVFARCLAMQVDEIAAGLGDYDILEIGAGSGQMAMDLLTALDESAWPQQYRILERSADLRAVQEQLLGSLPEKLASRVSWLDQPPTSPWRGVILANEVIDALPVERFRTEADQVRRLCVGLEEDQFHWQLGDWGDGTAAAIKATLGTTLLPGYQSEWCSLLPGWLESVTSNLAEGVALFMDYGYPRHEYYLPQRRDGTLICHYRHRAHDDPFLWPGLQDITASVDFTALAEAGQQCGLECAGYTGQAMFLIGCGLAGLMQELESLPDRERMMLAGEIRELTLPGSMGERFQCMALSRQFDTPMRGFSESDLRGRL